VSHPDPLYDPADRELTLDVDESIDDDAQMDEQIEEQNRGTGVAMFDLQHKDKDELHIVMRKLTANMLEALQVIHRIETGWKQQEATFVEHLDKYEAEYLQKQKGKTDAQ